MIIWISKFPTLYRRDGCFVERITSLQNPLVKYLSKLNTPTSRRSERLFLIEGRKLCEEALNNGLEICYCLCGDDSAALELCNRCLSAQKFLVSDSVIAKLSSAKTPQKIVMAARIPDESDTEIEGDIVLALDGISDPANLGSMLRTAEAFGVSHIFCSDQTVDLYSPKVLRGAMGSSFRVHVHRGDLVSALQILHRDGYCIYSTALTGNDVLLHDVDFSSKCVIVIGNEGNGVSGEVLGLSERNILIPMKGKKESLNAAAAAAVVLWQALYSKGML